MAIYQSVPYRNATTIANKLMALILTAEEPSMAVANMARTWLEVEQLKREWRGLPRLKPASAKELFDAKRSAAKHAEPTDAFIELDAAPTEPTTPQPATVTAPPTP